MFGWYGKDGERVRRWVAGGLLALAVAACGGGAGDSAEPPPTGGGNPDSTLALGDVAGHQTVLSAVPPAGGGGGGGGGGAEPTTLTIHYQRPGGDYDGWQVHSWNAAADPGWNSGHNASSRDSFGAVYPIPLVASSGTVGYLLHKGDEKDHGGADQSYVLKPGRNEIWRIQGDPTTYESDPTGGGVPDIAWVRVHYKRYDGDYAAWGLHLWNGSGLDSSRLAAGVTIEQWGDAVAFDRLPGYAAGSGEVVFDIPVLNPRGDASRRSLEFIVHGRGAKADDKDGRPDNIRVDFGSLSVRGQVGEVWLVQQDSRVYTARPDLRSASTTDARAVWLNRRVLQWPRVDTGGSVKLYHSARGQIVAPLDGSVAGADGSVALDAFNGTIDAAVAERFKWVGLGARFAVRDADLARLPELHRSQLVLVQEDATGKVMNATTVQVAGALDDLYGAADALRDLGVTIAGGQTRFRLWAPTAQRVLVFTYDSGSGAAVSWDEMSFDAATGSWTATRAGDLSGRYYRYAVEVFVRGVGVVRNLVTDPYAVSLTTDSARAYIADLGAAALKPAGWDTSRPPATVAAATDMSVYELHVRDFSAGDGSVSAAHRGKYMAFTESGSAGMQHLRALAQAGLTDVHLLPVFDIASVPEAGCTTPSVPAAAPDATAQQAAVAAAAAGDCFNWGYDPWHFNAPEGSYATDPADGARRILEFRQMVMGLHAAGLRVGMDVVYNHTTASGQNARSVLDRIVPGYYHRLNATGGVERSSCCENTATENLMMARLMIDSAVLWARHYKISSFRFDLMGHQPRAAMERLKAEVEAAVGGPVQLFGEGWNFGEVADGARFVQASQGRLDGSGIGTFGDKMRDAVRGGSGFDGGNELISRQGFVTGLVYAPNALGGGRPASDLMWLGDLIKGGLAGSIRDYPLTTHWDATLPLKDIGGVGYVSQPGEVVNYVENHDNWTLYDVGAFKLPAGTSTADRARVQMLGAALVALSQGSAYFHAGMDTLRSKSLDRNSYDSGDWFNRLDWTYQDSVFGSGLPPQGENGANWSVMGPLLRDAGLRPQPGDIAWARDQFRDLLRIRASTTLLRLRSADDIRARLRFLNTGSAQVPTVLAAQIDGQGYAGAGWRGLVYLVNVGTTAQTLAVPALAGQGWLLHPVHLAAGAADARVAAEARFDAAGAFTVPARSVAVFVRP